MKFRFLNCIALLSITFGACQSIPQGEKGSESSVKIKGSGTQNISHLSIVMVTVYNDTGEANHICTGTIVGINPLTILTAKKCLTNRIPYQIKVSSGWSGLGSYAQVNDIWRLNGTNIGADNDIALLRVVDNSPLGVTEANVLGIGLNEPPIGSDVVAYGYGANPSWPSSCDFALSQTNFRDSTQQTLRQRPFHWKQAGWGGILANHPAYACAGDIGGPVLQNVGGTQYIVGITSEPQLSQTHVGLVSSPSNKALIEQQIQIWKGQPPPSVDPPPTNPPDNPPSVYNCQGFASALPMSRSNTIYTYGVNDRNVGCNTTPNPIVLQINKGMSLVEVEAECQKLFHPIPIGVHYMKIGNHCVETGTADKTMTTCMQHYKYGPEAWTPSEITLIAFDELNNPCGCNQRKPTAYLRLQSGNYSDDYIRDRCLDFIRRQPPYPSIHYIGTKDEICQRTGNLDLSRDTCIDLVKRQRTGGVISPPPGQETPPVLNTACAIFDASKTCKEYPRPCHYLGGGVRCSCWFRVNPADPNENADHSEDFMTPRWVGGDTRCN